MKKSYLQYCGLARALDLVGERWTLLLVRELLTGPKRFSQLVAGLEGMGPNLLTARLKSLQQAGIVEKVNRTYQLTDFGWGLEKVVFSLAGWGSQTMSGPEKQERMDPGWLLLSLTRAYQGGLRVVVGISVGERQFEISARPERLYVRERPAVAPDVAVEASSLPGLIAVLKKGKPWREHLKVEGDLEVWQQFLAALAIA